MFTRLHKFILFLLTGFTLHAQIPTATIVVPSGTLCSGKTYSFSSTTSNTPVSFKWTVFPSLSVTATPDLNGQNVNLNFGRNGVYSLSLQVTNATGSTVATTTVNVSLNAIAAFNASLNTTGFPSQLFLTNYSSNHLSNQWLYSDAVSDFSVNTVKNYTVSGNYTVTLVAYGTNACNDTSRYSFRIADSSGITLPNIFTPNNDSINDIFKPIARGIVKMEAYIFNRYGTPIHHWDKPQGYWDGRTSSGEPCQSGIYFCVLEATGFDGKTYKMKTQFTLLR